MLRKILFLHLIISFPICLVSQTIGGSFVIGVPQSEFRNEVDNIAYGFNAEGTFWSPSKFRPYTVGLNIGYLIYGEENQRQPFSRTIGFVDVNVNTTYSLLNFHLLFKVSPFTGTWRLYLEGLFGGDYIYTRSKVENISTDEEIVGSTNLDDFAWSYGGGGGLMILLSEEIEEFTQIYLDLKARYLFGSEAEYLKEGSIREDSNGNVIYDLSKSQIDLLNFHVGVMIYF